MLLKDINENCYHRLFKVLTCIAAVPCWGMFRMFKCRAIGNGSCWIKQRHYVIILFQDVAFFFCGRFIFAPKFEVDLLCVYQICSCRSQEAAVRGSMSGRGSSWRDWWSWCSRGSWTVRSCCSSMCSEGSPLVQPFASWWSSSGSLWRCQSCMLQGKHGLNERCFI